MCYTNYVYSKFKPHLSCSVFRKFITKNIDEKTLLDTAFNTTAVESLK